ncbi:2-desacetyl-2-hydroxyethyl bacteriochlorophyllide A dehydrogenase [Clostridium algifaecis]|uniref:2-desacetyl-2-hydroxyethyl bacteriochlorophyllide A dehydrogenase n=1 Tax=Clostridium algifaecis TaxID=1472040 RepID=A0ABS4KVB1_9CLOT|nr:alcohol dehydrogenase catalytic domain-containing protein [Clostridium algifaecis]MBP2033974.1 2-desacetyl-2-hydroxyethyl bacteriochlorophyllide A dehydrogenase [Clostridium algifaecis]
MKAAVIEEFNNIVMKEVLEPELGYDEALIKVEYAGICGTDVHIYQGHHKQAKPPLIPGHEFVGRLVKVNTDKHVNLKIGQRVVAQPLTGCGKCELCIQGRDNVCVDLNIFGIHSNGCFAEYIKVPLRKVYSVPEDIDPKIVALVEPLAVAMHDVRRSNLDVGQTVLIIGGGPIGILIAMVAKLNGASKVVISEINEKRIKFAEDMNMRFEMINPLKDDVDSKINKLTNNMGFDVVYEVSGVQAGADLMTKAAKIGGTIMMVGIPSKSHTVDTGAVTLKELKMEGVRIHAQINFAAAVDVISKNIFNDKLKRLITDEFDIENVKEAMEFSIKDKDHFKVLLKMN